VERSDGAAENTTLPTATGVDVGASDEGREPRAERHRHGHEQAAALVDTRSVCMCVCVCVSINSLVTVGMSDCRA